MTIKERIFLVGCPRSGTTLLQSFIAAHSQITSFPESKFFQRSIYPHTIRSRLGIASARARVNFERFLTDINHEDKKAFLPRNAIFIAQYAKAFVEALDTITVQENKCCWLEKTPAHLQRIKYIEKFVPQSKFIHIIRNGEDVVASLYDVTHKFPKTWNGSWNIDKCIQRWLTDVEISSTHSHKPNHLLVRYDSLVENSQLILEEICDFLQLPFETAMLEDRAKVVKRLIRDNERWKKSVGQIVSNNKSEKFNLLFDELTQQQITNRVKAINVEQLC